MTERRGNKRNRVDSPPGRLRIVAGKWRGRLLTVAAVPGLRPTSERIRETLFNWLAPRLDGARCLDLFAGSGALGFEALSRGAAAVTFVEYARPALRALRDSVSRLEADAAAIRSEDAYRLLRTTPEKPFDIVFLDPPYRDESISELCRLLQRHRWLAPDARVYFEQDKRQAPAELPDGWSVQKQKTAGQVRYTLAAAGVC